MRGAALFANVEWGEYKIGDLFDSSNGDFDIQKAHINGRGEYVITSGVANDGIAGRTDIEARLFEEKTITVDMFGNVFYRNFKYKMVTHARVFSLRPKFAISDRQGLFLANTLRWLSHKYSYDQMCSWEKIKDSTIFLPTREEKIDFAFMEAFVAELEAQRVAELEAYLTATGLRDYHLTADERAALSADDIQWGGV